MAMNNHPIYSGQGHVDWLGSLLTTASTAKDGTGASLIYTSDAANGSYVREMRFRAAGSNVATVARVWVNNGSTPGTAANNILIDEITLSATTLSEVAALQPYVMPLGFALNPGYRLYAAIGTTVAAGYYVCAIGGKYTAL